MPSSEFNSSKLDQKMDSLVDIAIDLLKEKTGKDVSKVANEIVDETQQKLDKKELKVKVKPQETDEIERYTQELTNKLNRIMLNTSGKLSAAMVQNFSESFIQLQKIGEKTGQNLVSIYQNLFDDLNDATRRKSWTTTPTEVLMPTYRQNGEKLYNARLGIKPKKNEKEQQAKSEERSMNRKMNVIADEINAEKEKLRLMRELKIANEEIEKQEQRIADLKQKGLEAVRENRSKKKQNNTDQIPKEIKSYQDLKKVIEELETTYNNLQRAKYTKQYGGDYIDQLSGRVIDISDYHSSDTEDDSKLDKLKSKMLKIYSLYKNINSAIKNNQGWYKGEQYDNTDLESLIQDFKAYAQAYHELSIEYNEAADRINQDMGSESIQHLESLDSVTSKMTKDFKGYVKEVIDNSQAVKENNALYDEEQKEIQQSNALLAERYKLLRDLVIKTAKSKGVDKDKISDALPFLSDFEDYTRMQDFNQPLLSNDFGSETIDVLKEVAKIFGFEIPKAIQKTTQDTDRATDAFHKWYQQAFDYSVSDNVHPAIPMDGGKAERGAYNQVRSDLNVMADEVLRLQKEYNEFDTNRPVRELEKLEEELRDAETRFAGTYLAANRFWNESLDKAKGGASKKVQDVFGFIMGTNSFDENGAWGRNSKILENKAQDIGEHIQQIFKSLGANQISSQNLFTWLEENGTSAEKEVFKVADGIEEFRKVLRGLSTTSGGAFDFSETLGLDVVTLQLEEIEKRGKSVKNTIPNETPVSSPTYSEDTNGQLSFVENLSEAEHREEIAANDAADAELNLGSARREANNSTSSDSIDENTKKTEANTKAKKENLSIEEEFQKIVGNSAYYRKQHEEATKDSYDYTQALTKIANRTYHVRPNDPETGAENSFSVLDVNYDKLTSEMVKNEKAIVVLQHEIANSSKEAAAPLMKNLEIEQDRKKMYEELLDLMVRRDEFEIDESHAGVTHAQIQEARTVLENQLKSRDIAREQSESDKNQISLSDRILKLDKQILDLQTEKNKYNLDDNSAIAAKIQLIQKVRDAYVDAFESNASQNEINILQAKRTEQLNIAALDRQHAKEKKDSLAQEKNDVKEIAKIQREAAQEESARIAEERKNNKTRFEARKQNILDTYKSVSSQNRQDYYNKKENAFMRESFKQSDWEDAIKENKAYNQHQAEIAAALKERKAAMFEILNIDKEINKQKNNEAGKVEVDRLKEQRNEQIKIVQEKNKYLQAEKAQSQMSQQNLEFQKQLSYQIKAQKAAKKDAQDAADAKVVKQAETNFNKRVSDIVGSDKKLADWESSGKYTDKLVKDITKLRSIIQTINKKPLNLSDPKDVALLEDAEKALEKIQHNTKLADYKAPALESIAKLDAQIDEFMARNTAMGSKFREQFNNLKIQLDGAESIDEVKRIVAEFNNLKGAVARANQTGKSFFDTFKERLKGVNAQLIAQLLSWQDIIRYGRQIFSVIQQLDTALVDLRKTTTMNNEDLNEFYSNSNKIAIQLGTTTEQIISQAAAWSRLGYSTKEEAENMAALSSQFAAISPGMSLEQATDGLVSTMKGFGIAVEDTERTIMDNVNRIGNTFATSNEEIMEMLKRSSAAMNEANNTLEETIALESAAVQVTRNAETTGTAFRTEFVLVYSNMHYVYI